MQEATGARLVKKELADDRRVFPCEDPWARPLPTPWQPAVLIPIRTGPT